MIPATDTTEATEAATPPRDLRTEYDRALRACTPKQRKWLREVAAMAGQKWGACYKLKFSSHTVWKWLREDHVKWVLTLQAEMAELDSDITRERTNREYGRLAYSNIGQFYGPDGQFKQPKDWTEEMAAAVESVELDVNGKVIKLKLHRKGSALDAVARMKNMLVEAHNHRHTVAVPPGNAPIQLAVTMLGAVAQVDDPNQAMALYSELMAGGKPAK